jgi:predicted Zn-ribbon and HTH transcriptional regulator
MCTDVSRSGSMYVVIPCSCVSCGLRYSFTVKVRPDVCVDCARLETRAEYSLWRLVDL